jgi:hypothetical protein
MIFQKTFKGDSKNILKKKRPKGVSVAHDLVFTPRLDTLTNKKKCI